MKIINLKAENIKRIEAVDITPQDNTVVISGKNGQGKSSVLDSILWALGGASEIDDKPIRDGSDKAVIKLDLGDIIVERKFVAGKSSSLVVSTKEGAKYNKPQDILDGMLGAITFDPLAFANQKPKDQADIMKKLVAVDVDFDALEALNKGDFSKRTDINREGHELKAVIESLEKEVPADAPNELIDVSELSDQRAALTGQRDKKQRITQSLESMREDFRRHKAELDKLEESMTAATNAIAELPDIKDEDLEALRTKIESAQQLNNFVVKKQSLVEKNAKLEDLRVKSTALTDAMTARKASADAAIAAAKFPVEGLSFDSTGVLYNNIPFAQCSSAEKLKVSTAVAMSMNPKLKVIRIKDGALLDDENFEILKKMATENDFQIWVERVGADPMGIIIEDGKVLGAETPAAPPQIDDFAATEENNDTAA